MKIRKAWLEGFNKLFKPINLRVAPNKSKMNLTIGSTFKIKGNTYKNRTFTVLDISTDEYSFKCENDLGNIQYFSQTNFDYYGDKVQILSRPNFNKTLLQTAVQQTIAYYVQFENNPQGIKATLKAQDVLEQNDTVKFDGAKLEFISADSGKQRIVTEFGCVESYCDCKNQTSYHQSLFRILTRYNQLQSETTVRAFRPKVRREVRMAA